MNTRRWTIVVEIPAPDDDERLSRHFCRRLRSLCELEGRGLAVHAQAAEEQDRNCIVGNAELLSPARAVDLLAGEALGRHTERNDWQHGAGKRGRADALAKVFLGRRQHARHCVLHGLRRADQCVPRHDRRDGNVRDAVQRHARTNRVGHAAQGIGTVTEKATCASFLRDPWDGQVEHGLLAQNPDIGSADRVRFQTSPKSLDRLGKMLGAPLFEAQPVDVRVLSLFQKGR
jgi:hypothetical protein